MILHRYHPALPMAQQPALRYHEAACRNHCRLTEYCQQIYLKNLSVIVILHLKSVLLMTLYLLLTWWLIKNYMIDPQICQHPEFSWFCYKAPPTSIL